MSNKVDSSISNTSNKVFDVIVIGGGPGGSVAAKIAAEKGFSTLLIEKELISLDGRYKACGGAMAWELIEAVNYPVDKIDRIIENLTLHSDNGKLFTKDGKGAVLWRSKFDKFLLDKAINARAQVNEDTKLLDIKKDESNNAKYKIISNKGFFYGNWIIAADSVNSATLKSLKWPNFKQEDLVLTITKEIRIGKERIRELLGDDTIHLFFGEKISEMGYGWLFPKKDIVSVGWGLALSKIKNSREEFKRFEEEPLVKKVINGGKLEKYAPHLIPVHIRGRLYSENVFAVGDAGGLVDPISGKGIPYAMLSGQLAINSLSYAIRKGKEEKLESIYLRRLRSKFLSILEAKIALRERIFQSRENLDKFLELWQKYRSSEILLKRLM